MHREKSITTWISLYKEGNLEAAHPLWEAYFHRLIGLARVLLQTKSPGWDDEEDVAISAIKSAFRGIERGQYPRLNDGADLWSLLAAITRNKAVDALRKSQKSPVSASDSQMEQLASMEPTPEMAAQFADECRHLLSRLDPDNLPESLREKNLKEIALLKLDGCSNKVIATKFHRGLRSIERSLSIIRTIWQQSEL